MFVAHFENTMRNAKFAAPQPQLVIATEPTRLSAERQAQMERIAAAQKQLDQARIQFERELTQANGIIALATATVTSKTRSYRSIEKAACRVFGFRKVELHSNRRHRRIVLARQFVMYWACRLTKHSLPEIGRLLGGLDHTTIIHGHRVYPEKRARMGRTLRPLDQRQGPANG